MLRTAFAIFAALLTAGAAPAGVVTKTIDYEYNGTKLKGFLAYDDSTTGKRPGVLVVHEWWGLNDYAKERCKKLAASATSPLPAICMARASSSIIPTMPARWRPLSART